MTVIEDLVSRNIHAGLIAQAAQTLGVTITQLPLNLVDWGDGKIWSQVAEAAGVEFPQEATRREVRFLLTLENPS